MSTHSTQPINRQASVPVRTLRVEVVEGTNSGMTVEAESEVMTLGTGPGNDVELNDPTVSQYHLELARTATGIQVTDLNSTNGTLLGTARIRSGVIQPGTVLALGESKLKVSDGSGAVVEVHDGNRLGDMLGQSPGMRRLMAKLQRVARTPVPVLINGESGTGKELVARALHEQSQRAAKPFVTVDCGSLAPTLIASELFGHERGAFTGAERQHIGAFERAHGGTLFLDEIGELPTDLQPQLLGALERRRFNRVGGRQEVSVDVRVVCATNRDLREEVNSGAFRMDLYYRIGVVVLKLPPLRERLEDLPLLIDHFLQEAGHEGSLSDVAPDATLAELRQHRWPGNVRELRNWVEATLAMGEAPELFDSAGPPSEGPSGVVTSVLGLPYKDARTAVLNDFEARYVADLLERAQGNVSQAARTARMDRSYLIKLLQRHGIKSGKD